MTRVYDALQKSRNKQVHAVLTAIDDEQAENNRVLTAVAGSSPQPGVSIPLAHAESAAGSVRPVEEPPRSTFDSVAPAVEYRRVTVHLDSNPLLFPFDGPHLPAADQYRVLRTNIVHHPASPSLIVVSSATPGDGKTLTVINTAGILARKNEGNVLIIDGDLRRRSVAPFLGIEEQPGFADVLQGRCSLDEAIASIDVIPNLHVLTAGTPSINPAELLDSSACREILTSLRKRFSYIIVDTAPIGVLTDFDLVQACCDGVIVVVRPDHTDRKLLQDAITYLPADSVLGVVINAHQNWLFSKTSTAYAYEYDKSSGEPWHARRKT